MFPGRAEASCAGNQKPQQRDRAEAGVVDRAQTAGEQGQRGRGDRIPKSLNVTEHPTAHWTAQQIVEAFPNDTAPPYLLRDRDRAMASSSGIV